MIPPQDGYAVRSTYAPGDYEVAFEALAGKPQATLDEGYVAYISTGVTLADPATTSVLERLS